MSTCDYVDRRCVNAWENTLTNLRDYIYQHGSFPRQRGGIDGLGKWACVQRSGFKTKRMNEERRPKWEKFIKETDAYLKNRDSSQKDKPSVNVEWKNCFQRLQVFVVLNGRLPVLVIGTLAHFALNGISRPECKESELALWYQEQLERCSSDSEERRLLNSLLVSLTD